jgi:hypothetical protein
MNGHEYILNIGVNWGKFKLLGKIWGCCCWLWVDLLGLKVGKFGVDVMCVFVWWTVWAGSGESMQE